MLVHAQRCRLIVLAIEIGGRFSSEAATFLRLLARARARAAPATLQQTAAPALVSRWSALLAHAAHRLRGIIGHGCTHRHLSTRWGGSPHQ